MDSFSLGKKLRALRKQKLPNEENRKFANLKQLIATRINMLVFLTFLRFDFELPNEENRKFANLKQLIDNLKQLIATRINIQTYIDIIIPKNLFHHNSVNCETNMFILEDLSGSLLWYFRDTNLKQLIATRINNL